MSNPHHPPRACITGIGALTPFSSGQGADSWSRIAASLTKGTPAFEPWRDELDPPFPGARLGLVRDYPKEQYFDARQLRLMDKAMSLGFVAAAFALEDAGLPLDGELAGRDDVATVLASSQGDKASLFRFSSPLHKPSRGNVNPAMFPMIARNVACGQMAISLGARGWSTMIAAGPDGGAHALLRAAHLIATGRASTVIVGAFEVQSQFGLHLRRVELAHQHARGLNLEVNDWVPVEAACIFVVESEEQAALRGRRPHALIEHGVHGVSQGARGQGWSALFDRFLRAHPAPDSIRGANRISCSSPWDGEAPHAEAVQALATHTATACQNPVEHRTRPLFGDAQSVNALFGVAQACRYLSEPPGQHAGAPRVLLSSLTRTGSYALVSLKPA